MTPLVTSHQVVLKLCKTGVPKEKRQNQKEEMFASSSWPQPHLPQQREVLVTVQQ